MAEEPQQVTKEPQQVQQEPQRVTTKNSKKVEGGKRLAAHNRKKREEWRKEQAKIGCHRSCIGDDQRVSHQTEDLTRSHQCIKHGECSDVNRRSISECTSFHW